MEISYKDSNGDIVWVSEQNPLPSAATVDTATLATSAKQDILNNRFAPISFDAGGRQRVSELTTLFDGKTLNADEPDLWHGAGGGTATFDVANNAMQLSVTAGQWYVRQSNWYLPYFSGKSQFVELTVMDFAPQAGVIKRVGYFSSSATTPHTAELDGYWLESNGDISTDPATAIRLVIAKFGIQTAIALQDWSNYADFSGYNWNNFTIAPSDFLWLGGNDLRQFLSLRTGSFSAHTYEHAGNQAGVIFRSPNQPLRYEIRSSTGAGSFKFVCGQVSTEGSNNESGKSRAIWNSGSVGCNSVGTIYALLGIKKQVAYRNNAVKITDFGCVNTASSDSGILILYRNPTVSPAPLAYANSDRVQVSTFPSQNQTVTGGTVIAAMPIGQDGQSEEASDNFMLWLQNSINDTMAEYVLAYMPITGTQSVTGVLNYKVF